MDILKKRFLYAYTVWGLTVCTPPWFINFREMPEKWTFLWLSAQLCSAAVLLFLAWQRDQRVKRSQMVEAAKNEREGGHHG